MTWSGLTWLGAGSGCPACGCAIELTCGVPITVDLPGESEAAACAGGELKRCALCEPVISAPCNTARFRFQATSSVAAISTRGSAAGDTVVQVFRLMSSEPCPIPDTFPIACSDDLLCEERPLLARAYMDCLEFGARYEVVVMVREPPPGGIVVELECLTGFADCNRNCIDDAVDVQQGNSEDCNANFIPDECEPDCGGYPPGCAPFEDCNQNCVPDSEEIDGNDCNGNGILDACDGDCDLNGIADECDLADDPGLDGNGNGLIDACECGCTDVVFVIDDTGSMSGAIAQVREELNTIVEAALTGSTGDLRFGLVTFKDVVSVQNTLTADLKAVQESIVGLAATGGAFVPEASDEALRAIIEGSAQCGDGGGGFSTPFREECFRIAILITDATPGGCDDQYVPGIDDVAARARADDALANGIRISAIYVPTGGYNETIAVIMNTYAMRTGGVFSPVAANGTGTADAVVEVLFQCFACTADLDHSGEVDFADLLGLLASWGSCTGCPADLDFDGEVGFTDLLVILSTWGDC